MNNRFVNFSAMANKVYYDLIPKQLKINTNTYYKNCINGMLVGNVQKDIKN